MMSESNELLNVSDLSVNYSGSDSTKPALDSLCFNLNKGEILAIVGESGSGKSTAARALTKLLPTNTHLSGSVFFENKKDNLLSWTEKKLRKIRLLEIGYVFQEPSSSFNPVFSIGHQFTEYLKLVGIPAAERNSFASNSLEKLGIQDARAKLRAYPSEFSGGMLQRLAIAIATAAQPKLLIADEPTSALDATTQKRVIELLLDLNRQNQCAILFITHDLGLAYNFADRVIVMRNGKLVEEGNTKDVFHSPKNAYTDELIRAIPRLTL